MSGKTKWEPLTGPELDKIMKDAEENVAKLEAERLIRQEAEQELDRIRGIVGHPGTEVLPWEAPLHQIVQYGHHSWLEQTHAANQRVIEAEMKEDAANRAREEAEAQVASLERLLAAEKRGHEEAVKHRMQLTSMVTKLRTEKEELESLAEAMREALLAIKQRIHFAGVPGEPRFEDGSPDWSKEIAMLEAALSGGEKSKAWEALKSMVGSL